MRITIEPTGEFFMAGPVMVRAWKGQSSDGGPVIAFVAAVALGNGADTVPGLVSIPPPGPEEAAEWARRVLAGEAE